MSDKATPATDAEVVLIEQGNEVCTPCDEGCQYWWTCDGPSIQRLIARIEADGERMRGMERAIQRVGREAVVHTHPVGNGVKFEGHLVPNGAMMQLLAVLKEAPDA